MEIDDESSCSRSDGWDEDLEEYSMTDDDSETETETELLVVGEDDRVLPRDEDEEEDEHDSHLEPNLRYAKACFEVFWCLLVYTSQYESIVNQERALDIWVFKPLDEMIAERSFANQDVINMIFTTQMQESLRTAMEDEVIELPVDFSRTRELPFVRQSLLTYAGSLFPRHREVRHRILNKLLERGISVDERDGQIQRLWSDSIETERQFWVTWLAESVCVNPNVIPVIEGGSKSMTPLYRYAYDVIDNMEEHRWLMLFELWKMRETLKFPLVLHYIGL